MSFTGGHTCTGEARTAVVWGELGMHPYTATLREAPWRPIG